MDPKKLRHVLVLQEEASFVKAAQRVHLSQSALSRSIQVLEQELGVLLFDRTPAGVMATVAGQELIARARPLLRQLGGLAHDMRARKQGLSGPLAFGVGPFPAFSFLPGVLAGLARDCPELRIEVEVGHTAGLVEQLKAERLEFFIADTRSLGPDLELAHSAFAQQQAGLFCRAGHPLAGLPSINPAQLTGCRFAAVRLPAEVQALLRRLLGLESAQALPLALSCDHLPVLLHVVQASDVILLGTRASVQGEVAAGRLFELALGWPTLQAEMGLVSLRDRSLSPAALQVIERLRAAAQAGVKTGRARKTKGSS